MNNHSAVQPSLQSQVECEHFFKDVLEAIPTGLIAGGCLRDYFSRTPCTSDIDVFFPSHEALAEGISTIEQTDAEKFYDLPSVTGYMLNRKHVQLIKHHFYETIEDTIAALDFTVCCAAMDSTGRVVVHPHYFEDLAAKRLVINVLDFPCHTLERIPRYVEKGFRVSPGELLKLARAMKDVDFDDREQNRLQFYAGGEPRFGEFETGTATVA